MTTPFEVTTTFWDHATLWSEDDSDAGHSTDGGRVYGITRWRYVECDHYGCKPVAVIAYDDREQVERLAVAYTTVESARTGDEYRAWENRSAEARGRIVDGLAAALRGFANPPIPKPDEPTGLGAVVEATYEDDDGKGFGPAAWSRRGDGTWVCLTDGYSTHCVPWPFLRDVTVLSEGVTP